MKKKDIIEFEVDKMEFGGTSVSMYGNREIHMKGGITGQKVKAVVKKARSKKAEVKLDTKYTTDDRYNIGYANDDDGEEARENEIEGRVSNYIKGGYGSLSVNSSLYDFSVFRFYLEKSN